MITNVDVNRCGDSRWPPRWWRCCCLV